MAMMALMIVQIVDWISAMVRNKDGGLCEGTRRRRCETTETQSEMNNADSQPQKKRRKLQTLSFGRVEYVKRIADWIGNDDITTIGIYGMGGIGKTTLVKELYTQLLNNDIGSIDTHEATWVTVEMGFTVFQLQKLIAAVFGLDLEGDKDVNRRAARLHAFLSTYDKFILFIDNLWSAFRREDVGIPKNCKLIIISRLLDVCRMLHCQKVIKVEPLSEEESWQTFHHIVGEYGVLDSKQVSSKIVYEESAGLPLSIAALANSMTVVDDATKKSEFYIGQTQFEGMLNQLKLSYNRLNNIKLQRCFLHCAKYTESCISKEELIRLWIRQRLIDDVPSVQARYDMGYSILNKLIDSCLLKTCQDERSITMHDLVRCMAHFVERGCTTVTANIPSSLQYCRNQVQVASFVNSLPWLNIHEVSKRID